MCLQEGRVYSRVLARLAFPHSLPRKRATSRGLVTSLALVISPPATSLRRTTQQAALAAPTSLTVTWLSWLIHGGLTPGQSGCTRCPGASDVCSILSRWLPYKVLQMTHSRVCKRNLTQSKQQNSLSSFIVCLDPVWKPNDLCDWERSLWEDVMHRAVRWLEDTVL